MDDAPVKKLSNILVPQKYKMVKEAYHAIKNSSEEISDWKLITNKNKVEDYVVEWCKYHFGQAQEM